jgi:hypothetical protein
VKIRWPFLAAAALALAVLPVVALAQGSDPVMALGGGALGSALGSVIGAAVGAWKAVRKSWDEETTAKVRNILAEELLRHELACPLRLARGVPPTTPIPAAVPPGGIA